MDGILLLSLLVRIGCAFFFFFLSEAHISLKCEQCTLTVVFF